MKKQNIKINKLVLFVQIFWLIITWFYVVHVNKISTEWYTLKKLQEEREILLSDQESLNLKISRIQSLESLKKEVSISDMIPYEKPIFYETNKELALEKK